MASSVPDSHGGKALHTASDGFQPYGPASESPAEFTFKAVVFGASFGWLFGASTVYLGLQADARIDRFQVVGTLLPWFRVETGLAMIAGGVLFLALATITARMGRRKAM